MHIHQYLEKINYGLLINFAVFCQKMAVADHSMATLLKIFSAQKITKLSYRVSIINESLFADLCTEFPVINVVDRVSAAKAGDSHRRSVSRSMITLWPYASDHPVVIINDDNQTITPIPLGKYLLIIENQENFIRKTDTLLFLKNQIINFSDKDMDIAFGSGNEITNKLNKAFFSGYERIDCLLDLDIGGLTTFATLSDLTQHPQLNFLVPPCAGRLIDEVTGTKNNLLDKHLPKLRHYKSKYPLMKPAIDLMVGRKKMLEQERYLSEIT